MFSIRGIFRSKTKTGHDDPVAVQAARKDYDFIRSNFYDDFKNSDDPAGFAMSLDYAAMPEHLFHWMCHEVQIGSAFLSLGREKAQELLKKILLAVRPSAEEEKAYLQRRENFADALLADDDIRTYLQSGPGDIMPDHAALQVIAEKMTGAYAHSFGIEISKSMTIAENALANAPFGGRAYYSGMSVMPATDPRVFLAGVLASCVEEQYVVSEKSPDSAYAGAIDFSNHQERAAQVSTPAEFADYIAMPFADRVISLTASACEKLSVPPPPLAQSLWDRQMERRFYKEGEKPETVEDIADIVTDMNNVPEKVLLEGHIFLRNLAKLLPEDMQKGRNKPTHYFDPDNRALPDITIAANVDPETGAAFKKAIELDWLFQVPPVIRNLISERKFTIEICRYRNSETMTDEEKSNASTYEAGSHNRYLNKVRVFTHFLEDGVEKPIEEGGLQHVFLHEISHATAVCFYGMINAENSGLKKNYIRDINTLEERGFGQLKQIISYNLPTSHGGDHDSLDLACEEAFCDSLAGMLGYGGNYLDRVITLKNALPNFHQSIQAFLAGVHVMQDTGIKRDDVTFGGRISRENNGYTQKQLDDDKAQAAQRIEFAVRGGPVFFG